MTAVRRFIGLFVEPVPATSSAAADGPPSAGPTPPASEERRAHAPAPAEGQRPSWIPPRAPVVVAASADPSAAAAIRSIAPADASAQLNQPARSGLGGIWAGPAAKPRVRALRRDPSPPPGSSPFPPASPRTSFQARSARASWPPAAEATTAVPLRAAVLGTSERAVAPIAAAAAAELRVRARAPAALVALWRPDAPARTPAAAALPAARGLAARLTTEAQRATACARLAWVVLPADPAEAADRVRQLAARAGVPVVLGLCGPRADALEPLLAEQDVAVAVLPSDADAALRTLAFLALPTPVRSIHAPVPAGPARWAAMTGLGRLRSLPALAREGAGG